MVGWDPANREELRKHSKLFTPKDPPPPPPPPPPPLFAESDDSLPSLHDPFFDFSFIDDWILDDPVVMRPNDDMKAENPGGSVPNVVECAISQQTHQEITTESQNPPHPDCSCSDSGLKTAQVGILGVFEETHQQNLGKYALVQNGSDSKLVEQGFLHEFGARNGTDCKEVELGVLGVSIEREMEKFSLVGACDGVSVDYGIPSGEGDGSLIMESEKLVMPKVKGNGRREVNVPDSVVNMESNAPCGEIVSHKDESNGGRDGSLLMDCDKIAMSKENSAGGSEANVSCTIVNVESDVTKNSHAESGEMVIHEDESSGRGSDADDSSGDSSDSSSSSSEDDEVTDDDDGGGDDDVEEEGGKDVDIEEGEITNFEAEEIALGSGDEEEGAVKGPIRSKNELEILPPVPAVDVVLEPHHRTLPVGVVLSIIGNKVIVEGAEKHNPLNEGSILWITETRVPLGLIDEIFGPVKNPYYVVRFNSEKEVPTGICQGTAVSFVSDFADHILNDKNLYKKGYDASGENDEELSDEVEFSDDEKEAEYKRLRQITKRGKDDRKHGISEFRQKKVQVKGGFHKNLQHPIPTSPGCIGPPRPTFSGLNFVPSQVEGPSLPVSHGCGSCGCSHGPGQVEGSGPPIPHMTGGPTLHSLPPSNPVWPTGMPLQQQHMHLPSEFSMNGMQNHLQPIHYHQHHQQLQMFAGFPNGIPYQPQFNPSQMQVFPNGIPFQPQFNPSQMQTATSAPFVGNLCVGSTPTSLTGNMGLGFFNQLPFGMGIQSQGQHPHSYGCMGEQGDSSSGQFPPSTSQGGFSVPRQFSPGMASNPGRRFPPRGGRSNFSGGRGPKQKR